MILVFSLVFVFLWGYLKKFPRPNRLKMILAVTVFSILVSLVVSFISVYGFYGAYDTDNFEVLIARHDPTLARFSLPFFLEIGPSWSVDYGSIVSARFFRIYLTDVQLWEIKFYISRNARYYEGRLVTYLEPAPEQLNVNYTVPLFYQLLLTLTPLNMIGALLGAVTYKLRIWKPLVRLLFPN